MIEFDRRQFEEYARAVFTTDSPSGCTADAIALIKSYVEELGYTTHVHNKGTLEVDVPGLDESKTVATSAHVDTLGMMVRSVKSGGTLALTKVGGPICPTLDGEYCTVLTREGRRYSGTILSLAPAVHVYPDAATMTRDADHLEVRLDEEVKSAEDVKALGIDNGDFVFIDPKFTMTGSGFLKSRFIDDKPGLQKARSGHRRQGERGAAPSSAALVQREKGGVPPSDAHILCCIRRGRPRRECARARYR